jgi:tetratricopeptide (TPR) repeat protein
MSTRLAVLAAVFSLGCASARFNRENALAWAAADSRVLEGCYDCLQYARETYERIAASRKARTGDSIFVRIFETNLLLALREKELALDSRSTLDFARTSLPRLPASLDALRLLRMVEAVLPDGTGRPTTVERLRQTHARYIPGIPDEVAWLATAPIRPVVRNYIALALECSYADAKRKRPEIAANAPPITVYRTGTCTNVDPTIVWRALTAVPVFHEAAYFLGSAAAMAAEETGGEDAARLLSQAYARFPRAIGVTFMSGWLGSIIGDCPSAIRYFNETIALDTLHEQAMLQRTMCLSTLHQDSAAIASATQLIPIEMETKGQGYYWRAVSQLRLKSLPSARSDIEAAKALSRGPNVLTVAGIIEHDQNDLEIAEKDLREARDVFTGDQNCTAAWYLALVLNKGNRPRESAEQFELAMSCYDFKVAVIRSRIVRAQEKASQYPAFTAKRIARLAADSVDQRSRYYASAFNAAGNIANAGNRPRALELLAIAAIDPKLSEPVAKLRAAIGAMR